MQTSFHELSKESKELLFKINSLYLKSDQDNIQTTNAFRDIFLGDKHKNTDVLEANLKLLERFNYIIPSNSGMIAPTHEGLHYRESRFIYWKHKAIGPAIVSGLVSFAYPFIVDFISNTMKIIHTLWFQIPNS